MYIESDFAASFKATKQQTSKKAWEVSSQLTRPGERNPDGLVARRVGNDLEV
jgi:hypothetical protein